MKDFVLNRLKRTTLFLATGAAASILLAGPFLQTASAETQYGTPDQPLAGQRYQTMRALARYLDETAQGALEGATDGARHGTPAEARFLYSIRSFARRGADFHRMMDDYQVTPFEIPSQVADLTGRARGLNERLRSAHALESIYDEWDAMIDVLQRMTLLLAGHDVDVPAAYVVPALSGSSLEQFRQLARDLDVSAARAHERAKRTVGEYRDRGQQFLGELHYFAARSRDLQTRADTGHVDPQQIGPIVDRLLDEAGQADRRMRDARVFTQLWDDSGRTITILQRMASLVRS